MILLHLIFAELTLVSCLDSVLLTSFADAVLPSFFTFCLSRPFFFELRIFLVQHRQFQSCADSKQRQQAWLTALLEERRWHHMCLSVWQLL